MYFVIFHGFLSSGRGRAYLNRPKPSAMGDEGWGTLDVILTNLDFIN